MKESNNPHRIYISGPMTGLQEWKIKENFMRAELELKERFPDAKIINPIHMMGFDDNLTYEEYMEIDLMLLDKCGTIYMLKGWQQSGGCNREYGYALAKVMIILEQEKGL